MIRFEYFLNISALHSKVPRFHEVFNFPLFLVVKRPLEGSDIDAHIHINIDKQIHQSLTEFQVPHIQT